MNRVSVTLPGSGAYALVVPDSAPGAPPAAQVGAALQGVPVPSIPADALTAGGVVQPSASPASLIPEMVTGTAFVTVTNSSGALPSGTVLPCDVREDYRMADGTRRLTPRYDQFIVGYQRPGDEASNTVEAVFPIRPLVLFDA